MKIFNYLIHLFLFFFITIISAQNPPARYAHSMDKVGDKIYLYGGEDDVSQFWLGDFWEYSYNSSNETGTWGEINATGDIPPATGEHSTVVYNDELYIIGGKTVIHPNEPSKAIAIHKYSPSTNKWTNLSFELATAPREMYGHATEVIGDKMYLSFQEQMWSFDLLTNVWEKLADSPYYDEALLNFRWHSTAVYGNNFYVVRGGMGTDGNVYIYHTETNSWSMKETDQTDFAPQNVWSAATWSDGERVFMAGGRLTDSSLLTKQATNNTVAMESFPIDNSFCYYNASTNKWYIVDPLLPFDTKYDAEIAPIPNVEKTLIQTGGLDKSGEKSEETKVIKYELKEDKDKVKLITSVLPSDAKADGCAVSPTGGTYVKNTSVDLTATAADGWVFSKWTGDASGSTPGITLLMDSDKSAIANFQPILELTLTSPEANNHCPPSVDSEDLHIATASIFVDGVDWLLTGITFNALGKSKTDFIEPYLLVKGTKHECAFAANADSTIANVVCALNEIIREGTTLEVQLYYKISLPNFSSDIDVKVPLNEVKEMGVSTSIANLNCLPIPDEAKPGLKSPIKEQYSAVQTMANVWRISLLEAAIPYKTIPEAIQDSLTKDGHTIEICEGYYQHTNRMDITKVLYIIGTGDVDKTVLERTRESSNTETYSHDKYFLGLKSGSTISNLTFYNTALPINLNFTKNITISDCIFNKNDMHLNIDNSSNCTISKNVFSNCNYSTIESSVRIEYTKDSKIEKNNFFGNNGDDIVFHNDCDKTICSGNTFVGNTGEAGIRLFTTYNLTVYDNYLLKGERDNFIKVNDGENNKIISNEIEFGSKGGTGIYLFGAKKSTVRDNIILNPNLYGIKLSSNSKYIDVIHNKIEPVGMFSGIDVDDSYEINIEDNYIQKAAMGSNAGIELENTENFIIANNRVYDIFKYGSGYGIRLKNNTRMGSISGNKLIRNCTGLKIEKCPSVQIVIYNNQIKHNLCSNTGLNLDNFNGEIYSNNFEENVGAAISVNGNYIPSALELNNFEGNEASVINNTELDLTVNNNYWGQSTGPDENDLDGNITFSTWNEGPTSVVITKVSDTLLVNTTGADTVLISINNFANENDNLSVSVTDEMGLVEEITNQQVSLNDSTISIISIPFSIESNLEEGTRDKVVITVNSLSNPEQTAKDSFYIMSYNSVLTSISISPDLAVVAIDDSLQLSSLYIDQYSNTFDDSFNLTWSASAGSIDSTGLFIAPSEESVITIEVTEPVSGISSSTQISVLTNPNLPESLVITPDSVTVEPESYLQFFVTGIDKHGFNISVECEWTTTGGTIDSSGILTVTHQPGIYTVTALDTASGVEAVAYVTVETVTDVDDIENVIPTEYTLNQNYPNPFNPSTVINYQLPINSLVNLHIYNILGQRVATLADNKSITAGTYKQNWNASALSSGVYFVVMDAKAVSSDKEFHSVKKMMLLK